MKLLKIQADDGAALVARVFETEKPPMARLVVAGATGVPQAFYARFAAYAADQGLETYTLDVRGIGESKVGALSRLDTSFTEWAQRDLSALLEAIPEDELPLFWVGHSFGGHALGLIARPERLSGAWLCGVGAGWAGWNPPGERIKLWFAWNLLFPPLVKLKGYLPMSLLGAGEDLPRGVYKQWRRWCSYPHYFLDDPEAEAMRQACARVCTPILAMNSLDDAWAGPRSREAFLIAYPHAPIERVDIDPQVHGAPVGHIGYFRGSSAALWDQGLRWLRSKMPPSA